MRVLVLAFVALIGRVGVTAGHQDSPPYAQNQWEAITNLEPGQV